ncbi:MAG: hypothetical protein JXA69_01690 [Phycisphaerae bacterium]|nr:hypothetical protein [Phycisphaerae bacterium]
MMQPDHDVPSTNHKAAASDLRAAVHFLLPLGGAAPAACGRAAHWFVPIGLIIGVIYAALFAGVWRLYGEYFGLRLVPAAILLVLDAGLLGRHLLRGTCDITEQLAATPREPAAGMRAATLCLVLWLLVKFALLLTLPRGQDGAPSDWRRHLLFLYPQPVLRPLILMAMWGRWATLLGLSLGRARPGEPADFLRLVAGTRLGTVLGWFLPCAALTVMYCSQHRDFATGLLIAGVTLGVVYVVGVMLSWRLGGQTRASVWALGAFGELTFLAAYAPFGRLIHLW